MTNKLDDNAAKDKLPFMPLYVTDFVSSTARMTCAQRGAYITLLGALWQDGSLPNDPDELRRIAIADPDEWPAIWQAIGSRFITLEDGRLTQPRLERERVASLAKYKSRVNSARKAIEARWSKVRGEPSSNTPRNTSRNTSSNTPRNTDAILTRTISISNSSKPLTREDRTSAPPPNGRGAPFVPRTFLDPNGNLKPEGKRALELARDLGYPKQPSAIETPGGFETVVKNWKLDQEGKAKLAAQTPIDKTATPRSSAKDDESLPF